MLGGLNLQRLAPGTLLAGRYRLERELGRGGMAIVMRALDEKSSLPVALKVLVPGLEHSALALERLRREASAYASLSHPSIVKLHEFVVEDDMAFIAMELVDGPSLKQHIVVQGRLTPDETARIGSQIASALDAAHHQGVIHRDIKPQNVLLGPDGQVKVVDFGLARIGTLAGMTATRTTIGTPEYMAPEQIQAQPVDPRADLYALGVLLYECLAGRPPFGGQDIFAVFQQHLAGLVRPLSEVRPDVPAWLENVVLTCLRRRKEDRYHSAAAVLEALSGEDAPTLSLAAMPLAAGLRQETCAKCGGPAPELVGFCLHCGTGPESAPRTVDALVVEDKQRWERENRKLVQETIARLPASLAARLERRMQRRQRQELELLEKHAKEVERLREELEIPVAELALDERALLLLADRRSVGRWRRQKRRIGSGLAPFRRWLIYAHRRGAGPALQLLPLWSRVITVLLLSLSAVLLVLPGSSLFPLLGAAAVAAGGAHEAERRRGELKPAASAAPHTLPGGVLGRERVERIRTLVQGRPSRRVLEPLARLLAALAQTMRIARQHPKTIGAVVGDLTGPVCDLVDLALVFGGKAVLLEDYLAREKQDELEAELQRLEHRLGKADAATLEDLERLKAKKESLLLKRLDLDRQLEQFLARLSLTAAEAEDLLAALCRLALAQQSSEERRQPSMILSDLRYQLQAMEELFPAASVTP